MKTEQDLIDAGKAAIAEGLRLWHLDVIDPLPADLAAPLSTPSRQLAHTRALESRKLIDSIMVAAGWGFDTPYKGNRVGREWCGFFAAACWHAAGIDPKWLAPFWASTLRLRNWVTYRPWNDYANPRPAPNAPRRLSARLDERSTIASLPFAVREGDIVIVGDGTPAEGEHICLAMGVDVARNAVLTVEGNGVGIGPDGKHREGVVTGVRRLGGAGRRVLWIYRPAPSDLL